MRKVICGLLLPLVAAALTLWARFKWDTEISPPQLAWWLWTLVLYGSGAMMGFGVCAYWFKGGHRQDSKKIRD